MTLKTHPKYFGANMNPEELISIEKRLELGIIKPHDVVKLTNEVRSLQQKLESRIAEVEAIGHEIPRKQKKHHPSNDAKIEVPESSQM